MPIADYLATKISTMLFRDTNMSISAYSWKLFKGCNMIAHPENHWEKSKAEFKGSKQKSQPERKKHGSQVKKQSPKGRMNKYRNEHKGNPTKKKQNKDATLGFSHFSNLCYLVSFVLLPPSCDLEIKLTVICCRIFRS